MLGWCLPPLVQEGKGSQDRQSSFMVLSELQISTEPLTMQIYQNLKHCHVKEAVTVGHDYLVISVPPGISKQLKLRHFAL